MNNQFLNQKYFKHINKTAFNTNKYYSLKKKYNVNYIFNK